MESPFAAEMRSRRGRLDIAVVHQRVIAERRIRTMRRLLVRQSPAMRSTGRKMTSRSYGRLRPRPARSRPPARHLLCASRGNHCIRLMQPCCTHHPVLRAVARRRPRSVRYRQASSSCGQRETLALRRSGHGVEVLERRVDDSLLGTTDRFDAFDSFRVSHVARIAQGCDREVP